MIGGVGAKFPLTVWIPSKLVFMSQNWIGGKNSLGKKRYPPLGISLLFSGTVLTTMDPARAISVPRRAEIAAWDGGSAAIVQADATSLAPSTAEAASAMPQEPREEEDDTADNVMGQKDGDGWGQCHNPCRRRVVGPDRRGEMSRMTMASTLLPSPRHVVESHCMCGILTFKFES